MTDPFDFDSWDQKWAWRQAKAKEASHLPEEEIAFLDRAFAQRIKERLERQAASSWWALFGSQGHSLETLEDEARFVCELDKVFICPSASSLLSPANGARKSYTVRYRTKQAEQATTTFTAPTPSRLFELMLFGFFRYEGRWIYLSRQGSNATQHEQRPNQWMVLAETDSPHERLGLTITVNTYRGRETVQPTAVFSSLSARKKVELAADCGVTGTHQEWLQSIADNATKAGIREQTISILLAGQYATTGFPLAQLIANGGPVPGKRVEVINGSPFDLRTENLRTRSSRGRKMVCNACHRPTTDAESKRVKDSTGSTFRFCNACQKRAHRLSGSDWEQ